MTAQVDDGLAYDRRRREREQRPGDAVQPVADEQRQDDDDRVDPQADAEHLGRDDVALELLEGDEQEHDPDGAHRVVEQCDEYGRRGPMIGPI